MNTAQSSVKELLKEFSHVIRYEARLRREIKALEGASSGLTLKIAWQVLADEIEAIGADYSAIRTALRMRGVTWKELDNFTKACKGLVAGDKYFEGAWVLQKRTPNFIIALRFHNQLKERIKKNPWGGWG